jgi:hypothetical protein
MDEKPKSPLDNVETKLARALRQSKHTAAGKDPLLEEFREDLFEELRKLIPKAIEQAKKGKPALLRILTRYTR